MTGSVAVKNHYKDNVIHCFFPFDSQLIIKSFLSKINPKICILMETEIWPNLIYSLNKKKIPAALINARLSQKSFDKYQKFSPKLVNESLNRISIICSQNSFTSDRFISLGVNKEKILTCGSLKFDINDPIDQSTIKTLKNIVGDRSVAVFASTRDGEEKLIIESYLKLKNTIDSLILIVPRHPERFEEVFKISKATGLNVKRRSIGERCSEDTDILIGDSMGEMMAYYSISDIAFIGGSLTENGSQNMLEAASLSKPIIFGPSVYNFEEISKQLLDNDASIQVANADELMKTISELILSDSRREKLGVNARKIFEDNKGAVKKVLDAISLHIKT
jgi:3-deoxy-D-manno-octulosonic-acid transferase